MEKVYIRAAKEVESDDIDDFLEEHFSSGNPMELAYVHTKKREKMEQKKDHDGFIKKSIAKNNVLVAIDDSSNALVGVLIGNLLESRKKEELNTSTDIHCKARDDIDKFLAYISAKSNVIQRFNIERLFEIFIVSVHKNYRKQNIARKLFESGFDLAWKKQLEYVSVDCTSVYSSRIAESLVMECVSSVSYDEYNNYLGERLFVPILPHLDIKTFVKKIYSVQ